jgi:hypothetical protein
MAHTQSGILIAQAYFACAFALWAMAAHAADTPPGCPAGDYGITESALKPYGVIVIGLPKYASQRTLGAVDRQIFHS